MKLFFNILTILGFILTFIGTYLTIKSGEGHEIISEGLTFWCILGVMITSVAWYHYYHAYFIAKSVLQGRDELFQVHEKVLELNKLKKIKLDKGLTEFSIICQHICNGLRKYHSSEICVNIQYINNISVEENRRRDVVKMIARNTDSFNKRITHNNIDEKDYVEENSDFDEILYKIKHFNSNRHYYFSNFLAWNPYYKNTHLPKFHRNHRFLRILIKWPLAYRSAIVVPIKTIEDDKIMVWGFLSIDSDKSYAFSKKFDLPIAFEMAKSIAPVVKIFCNTQLITHKNLQQNEKN